MKILSKYGKNISIKIKEKYITCKNFSLLVKIFAVWESETENYLSMHLLKVPKDSVVRSQSERSFHKELRYN